MHPKEPSLPLLLDYLYGLLDTNETREVEELLQSSEPWRRALEEARSQQQILAAAAKSHFEHVQFRAPDAVPSSQAETISLTPPAAPRRRFSLQWAIAASVLFLLFAGGLAGGVSWYSYFSDYSSAQDRHARLQRRQAELQQQQQSAEEKARRQMREMQEQIKLLEAQWKGELQQVDKKHNEKQLQVLVTGPKTVQAGARNEYTIETRTPSAAKAPAPAPSKIQARVLKPKSREVLYETTIDNKSGVCSLELPRDLPVKPGEQVYLQVVALGDAGVKAEVKEALPLVGTLYLTHLAVDRPMYRPGEVVHFRSLTLDRFSLKPPHEDFQLYFVIKGPGGNKVHEQQGTAQLTTRKDSKEPDVTGPDGKVLRGIGAGEFTLPADAPGGEYTIEVYELQQKFPTQKKTFLVNRYQAPRLNKELEFARKTFGPGEEVRLTGKVARVDGGQAIDGQPAIVTAQVDGQQVSQQTLTVKKGELAASFQLPAKIEAGQGSVSIQFTDGANVETIVRPLPIVLKKLRVNFYPEGGDLIAGVKNRIYFEARTTLGKPAELKGHIVDSKGKELAVCQTLNDDKEAGVNQGMGLVEFTPEAGQTYELKIDAPIGIEGKYVLPQPKKDGVALLIREGVVTDKIGISVTSGQSDRKLLVGAYCRGRLIDHKKIGAAAGKTQDITLRPADGVSGVYRITVFEERKFPNRVHYLPVAERLIYRQPTEKLSFRITPDKKSYHPGDRVHLKIASVNEKDLPTPAVVLVSVVDKSIIKLADDKTERSMPTHFYLTTEVKKPEDLEYADFLVSDHPKAEAALDLLLGTQGWRRFIEQDPKLFEKHRQEADHLFFAAAVAQPQQRDLAQQAVLQVDEKFAPQWQAAQEKLAEVEVEQPRQHQKHVTALTALQAQVNQANRQRASAEAALAEQQSLLLRLSVLTLALLLFLAGVAGLIVGFVRVARRQSHAIPYLLTGIGALGLLLICGTAALFYALGSGMDMQNSALLFTAKRSAGERQGEKAMAPGKAGMPVTDIDPNAIKPDVDINYDVERLADVNVPGLANPNAPIGIAGGDIKDGPRMANGGAPGMGAPGGINFAGGFGGGMMGMNGFQNGQGMMGMGGIPQQGNMRGGMMGFAGGMPGGVPPVPVQPQAVAAPPAKHMFGVKKAGIPKAGAKPAAEIDFLADPNAPLGIAGGDMAAPPMNIPAPPGFGMMGGPMAPMPMKDVKDLPRQQGFLMGEQMEFAQKMPQWDETLLRRHGLYQQLAMQRLHRVVTALPPPAQPFYVRDYAHHNEHPIDGIRRDFAETLYWHPALVLANGETEIAFDLSDAVTTFRVQAWGHNLDGRLGASTEEITSRLPFSVEPKVPTEVSNTDKITIPVIVTNDTSSPRTVDLEASAGHLQVLGAPKFNFVVEAEKRQRQLFQFQPAKAEGLASLLFRGNCAPFGVDAVERSFKIVPEGFPFVGSKSDLLEGQAVQTIQLPKGLIKGSLQVRVQVFPSTLADLQKGLEGLLREPCGCFEQTSTSNYPNTMILSYLRETEQAAPEIEKQARAMLERGYDRLTSYECQKPEDNKVKRGYEWFGGTAPAHEALTAYGLMQFRDMAKFTRVDEAMLKRTEEYLLQQRDGKGGFKRNPRALDSFGQAPDHITNAYIVWSLTESGSKADLNREFTALQEKADKSNDPYFLSLVALSLFNKGDSKEAITLLKKVRDCQDKDGHVKGAETSITRSGGRDLEIETTALALLGWLRANRPDEFNGNIQKAASWIGQQRGGYGGYGSTQSTILALKALIAHARTNRKTAAAGEVVLWVNNEKVGSTTFAADQLGEIAVNVPEDKLNLFHEGDNKVKVELTNNALPYTLTWAYNTIQPANPAKAPVQLTAKLDRTTVNEGETVHLTATVENKSGQGQGMTVAILGLPAGLIVPEDMKQLKDMSRLPEDGSRPLISHFEIRGRELVLYWRDLAPEQKINVGIDLICRIPGEYRGPASRAYLYYNSDLKFWTEPLAVTIRPGS